MLPRTWNRSPTAACIPPTSLPRADATHAPEDTLAECPDCHAQYPPRLQGPDRPYAGSAHLAAKSGVGQPSQPHTWPHTESVRRNTGGLTGDRVAAPIGLRALALPEALPRS